ncbi:putative Glycosyltransferase [Quillaja saponaria]|uniref:Glycosyltransferase n=1 Tax=Quillaja saponaria TaxID=32244 RepID=A0AAD7P662_QUISA|nr:putative Glycosyltransferase [Quillaja saponaria]
MKRRFSTGSLLIGLLLCLVLIVLQIFRLSPISNSNNLSLFPIKAPSERPRGKVEVEKKGDPLALQSWQQTTVTTEISCNRSRLRYDLCKIDGPTVLDPTTATFFAMGPTSSTNPPLVEKIRPYPRKFEDFIMGQIKNITLISGSPSPLCEVQHNVPALVFTAGGYTGNFYHDFNDGFIPLFITVNTILFDQDFVIVVSEAPDWWSRAVLVQIVPIGVEWAADVYFGRVARGLSLEYMEYKIGVEESSLVDKYGKDNLLLKDPHALQKNGWPAEIMDIYLREQNVKLDLVRFKEYLVEAYKKAKKFMHKRG